MAARNDDPRFVRPVHPDAMRNLDGLTDAEFNNQLYHGVEPDPVPEPTPLHPAVTRAIIAAFAAMSAACAWFADSWIRNTGIAFAVLFFCAAILPARRPRRR